ncbi:hypothetical protein CO661_23585 [Sinorhizobium fredii]|uniref:Uncharacterized protein n=1 Tax=Rhizobium fredii TaxID=380 RepID=A0A2A6LT18_RHIFR|nr:hypothetical protein CO661_23585 [Sinorhizobium fredii]UTY50318.1 hypothetical protein EPK84_27945 [Sinorhizobium fredii]
MLVTGIQRRRVGGAEDSLQPKDLGWLDSCDKHRNEERKRSLAIPTDEAAGYCPHAEEPD